MRKRFRVSERIRAAHRERARLWFVDSVLRAVCMSGKPFKRFKRFTVFVIIVVYGFQIPLE